MSKSKVKIELNKQGVQALLKSAEITAACERVAKTEASRLGPSYKTDVYKGKNRVNVSVYTDDPAAMQDNLRNNTMLKTLGGR